jgi:RimJ/RimL family protein N-acetyltransferase
MSEYSATIQAAVDAELRQTALFPDFRLESQEVNRYTIFKGDTYVGEFFLRELPNCSAVCLAYGMKLHPSFRGQGIGKTFYRLWMRAAKRAGFGAMVGTIRDDNEITIRLVHSLGWTPAGLPMRSRHGGTVTMWQVHLA